MRNHSRSIVGIRLNTHLQPMHETPANKLRLACNDSTWGLEQALIAAKNKRSHRDARIFLSQLQTALYRVNDPLFPAWMRKLINRQHRKRDCTLTRLIEQRASQLLSSETGTCRLLEIGHKSHTLRHLMHKSSVLEHIQYLRAGADSYMNPNIKLNILNAHDVLQFRSIRPDIVLALDLWPEKTLTSESVQKVVSNLATLTKGCSLLVIRCPVTQCSSASSEVSQNHWIDIIGEHFIVEKILHETLISRSWSERLKRLPGIRHMSGRDGNDTTQLVIASSRYQFAADSKDLQDQ